MDIKPLRDYSTIRATEPKKLDDTSVTPSNSKAILNSQLENKPSMSVNQITKRLMNGQILAAQEKVTLASGNQSMALLYRSAIDAIDEELDLVLGENNVNKPLGGEIDYSPQATADRIVTFATGYFGLHQQQNVELDFDEQLNSFMDKISGAIEKGFNEAIAILDGLKVLEGDIAIGVEQTYQNVQSGLAKFKQDMLHFKDKTSE
ncbi:DUF5610 domain-containing protein [Shewanella aestuarii]|uniref:DUF5610 domain-containing protein n=1 Tax=Shewanella aestuarii TaxID=1028752 RepID=A0A6G9QN82_9GAMM|nr:DUF5610 domain-containing protein [Shewanella aestuarii]QIR15543.1 DUF5610 domain-containing protein [Shewanella aestuarii]